MKTSKKQFGTIEEYIKTLPSDVQTILEKIRQTIKKAAPEAVETISRFDSWSYFYYPTDKHQSGCIDNEQQTAWFGCSPWDSCSLVLEFCINLQARRFVSAQAYGAG